MNTANRIARIIACFDEAGKIRPDYSNDAEAKAAIAKNEALQAEALQLAGQLLSDTLGNIERIANALEKIAGEAAARPTLLGDDAPASAHSTNGMTADFKD